MTNSDLLKVIDEFGNKVTELMLEKETLNLQLSKQEILARTRAARISQLEHANESLLETLTAERALSEKLRIELEDSIAVLEQTICVNKALKKENESVSIIKDSLSRETLAAKRFEEMYLDLLNGNRAAQFIPRVPTISIHEKLDRGNKAHSFTQTDSPLLLCKYAQADEKPERSWESLNTSEA